MRIKISAAVNPKRRHRATLFAWALFAAIAEPGSAATAADANDAADDSVNATPKLDEIVVTANRREERLQDVPITVTAVTGDMLDKAGVTSVAQLIAVVPGLILDEKFANTSPFLRGQGLATGQPGLESSVATYVDDVYFATAAKSTYALSSISRVEVLRGPQGTLFGRNSSAGVIALYTKNPDRNSPAADADVEYGSYQTVKVRGYASVPVSSTLAANVAAYYSNQDDGWGHNFTRNQSYRDGSESNLRAKLMWQPHDRASVLVTGWYNSFDTTLGMPSQIPGTVANSVLAGPFTCASCTAFDVARSGNDYSKGSAGGVSAQASYAFDAFKVIDILAYQSNRSDFNVDIDGTPSPYYDIQQKGQDRALSNELRISSVKDGWLNWLGGIYYYDGPTHFQQYNTGAVASAGTLIRSRQDTKSIAGFAQLTASLSSRARLTLGGRYTEDKRSIFATTESFAGTVLSTVPKNSAKFSNFSYRIGLDYHLTDNVMAFAVVTDGFKSGLFNVGVPTAAVIQPEKVHSYEVGLKNELFDRRLRLNATVFHYDVNNQQVKTLAPGTSVPVFSNAAQAEADGVDLDFEIAVTDRLGIRGGAEYLDAKYKSFSTATQNVPRPATVGGYATLPYDATGATLPQAPKLSANLGVDYGLPLPERYGSINMYANYTYRSKHYFEPSHPLTEDGYGLVDAQIVWAPAGSSWKFSVWGKNLTNKDYAADLITSTFVALETPGAPRTVGVRVAVSLR